MARHVTQEAFPSCLLPGLSLLPGNSPLTRLTHWTFTPTPGAPPCTFFQSGCGSVPPKPARGQQAIQLGHQHQARGHLGVPVLSGTGPPPGDTQIHVELTPFPSSTLIIVEIVTPTGY